MPRSAALSLATVALFVLSCQSQPQSNKNPPVGPDGKQQFTAVYGTPVLDGSGADEVWELSDWLPIDRVWAGAQPTPDDFSGRYKLAWDENNLYILVEITDDSLLDIHTDETEHFWDDDCLEIFVDEDASGSAGQQAYNTFNYNISLDGRVRDIAPDSSFQYFDDHCLTRRISRGHVSTWEIAVRIFDGKQFNKQEENVPKLLKTGKKMGFALAYSDNDHSAERENWIGNVTMPKSITTQERVNPDVFGILTLQ